jgi:hypothetical protein
MKKSHTPLTLVEARREFAVLAKAFNDYVARTKHLKTSSCLTSSIGDGLLVKTDDERLPWLPLLYAAANVMTSEGDSPAEIRENFEHFLEDIVEKQGDERETPPDVSFFELMRALMVATIDELMPLLRPMHEFDAVVARAGRRRRAKNGAGQLPFYGALMGVLGDTRSTVPEPGVSDVH